LPGKQQPEKRGGRTSLNHEVLLQALLAGLKEGVIVCDSEARIILCNQAVAELFNNNPSPGPGDSLYYFCLQPPVKHALSLLKFQEQNKKSHQENPPYIQFMNSTGRQDRFFRCRLSLLPATTWPKESFIVIFEDISTWYNPDNPLYMKVEEFRSPMTNLRAAVENLTEHPEMSPVMRSAFENVLVQESFHLTEAFDSLAGACNLQLQTQSHLAEMSSGLLFDYVCHKLLLRNIPVSITADRAARVKVDSYGLVLVLEYLAGIILRERAPESIACECHIGENFVYFDFIWPGEFLPPAVVESLLKKRLKSSVGGLSIASIFHTMGGDMWSKQLENMKAVLRVALPVA
jgi:DNA polymerase-3 subunit epsilon